MKKEVNHLYWCNRKHQKIYFFFIIFLRIIARLGGYQKI